MNFTGFEWKSLKIIRRINKWTYVWVDIITTEKIILSSYLKLHYLAFLGHSPWKNEWITQDQDQEAEGLFQFYFH